ncbi:hypothetical protein LLEC1_03744 [Akanthomyces lecanii]|uniref:Uncharacterized protein n=1 Tax=Cordyceps confragosa TaxID=2714763 RepID=A0A179IHX1_CORDF|nr:hypothetical protein LLEC1_03744 [Akanthomyces lecanii]
MVDNTGLDEAQPSTEFLRLRWQVADGPAAACIKVLEDPEDATSAQQPFQAADGTFHAIGAAPCSSPPTAHLTLQIEEATYLGVEGDASEAAAPSREVAAAAGDDFITIRQYVETAHPWFVSQRRKHFEGYGYSENGGQTLPADAEMWFDPSSPNVIHFFDSVESEPPFTFEWSLVADVASGIIHGHEDDEEDYGDEDEGEIDPIEEMK